MRRGRTREADGLAALRRERSSFAALGMLLLLVQLLLSGFSQGAMAAERLLSADLGLICHTSETANHVAPGSSPTEPERHCPCLAGVCVVAALAVLPVGDGWDGVPGARAGTDSQSPVRTGTVPRPPFDLFARASRGPPPSV